MAIAFQAAGGHFTIQWEIQSPTEWQVGFANPCHAIGRGKILIEIKKGRTVNEAV